MGRHSKQNPRSSPWRHLVAWTAPEELALFENSGPCRPAAHTQESAFGLHSRGQRQLLANDLSVQQGRVDV